MNDIFLSFVSYLWSIGIKSNVEVLAVVLIPEVALLGLVYFIFMHVEELGLAAFWEQEQRLLGDRLARYNLQHERRVRDANSPAGKGAPAMPQGEPTVAAYTQDELVKDVVGYLRDEENK
nr:hypothetical protein [uncultured Anaeromusa sp.]